ncbi:hypothetical protein BPUN_3282 [Candidatus Paraburkholderia kirkii]|nr:hypothetical protein BPUN_3282 [Candidatus Paraburkholderia kirkii]
MHARAARTDRGEVVADAAAAAAHRLGRLQQRDIDARQAVAVDALNRIAHRLHEAIDERRVDARARRAHDAPRTERAAPEVVDELRFDLRAQRLRLGERDAARHAAIDILDARLVALGVFFEHHVDGKLLRCESSAGIVFSHVGSCERWAFGRWGRNAMHATPESPERAAKAMPDDSAISSRPPSTR